MTPERAMMAAEVLQHRQLETTMRCYVHGQQRLAARNYHAAIDDLIARAGREWTDLEWSEPMRAVIDARYSRWIQPARGPVPSSFITSEVQMRRHP